MADEKPEAPAADTKPTDAKAEPAKEKTKEKK